MKSPTSARIMAAIRKPKPGIDVYKRQARALPAEELAEQLRPGCGDVRTAGSPRQALRLAEELAHGGDLLVAGSFFLAAELRPLLLLDMREGRLS